MYGVAMTPSLVDTTDHPCTLEAEGFCDWADTDEDPFEGHGLTPHDWQAIEDALAHALGLIGPDQCYACYEARTAEASWEAHTEASNR